MMKSYPALCILMVLTVRSEPYQFGLGRYDSPSFGPDAVESEEIAVADSGEAAYDSTWPKPSIYQDVYEHNVWDPEFPTYRRDQAKRIRGTVDYLERVRLEDRKGHQTGHNIARLTLADGRVVLVELGENNLRFELASGARVTIEGETGRINGRRVIVASSIRADGRKYTIPRGGGASTTVSFSGTVNDVSTLRLTNEAGEKKTFTKITLKNGHVYLADLGGANRDDLGLTEGEQVAVRGQPDQISGRRYVRAAEIEVNGNKTRLR